MQTLVWNHFQLLPQKHKLPRNSRLGIRDKPIKWQHRSFITTLRRDIRTTSKRLDPLSIALFKLKTMRIDFTVFSIKADGATKYYTSRKYY